jgi:hypothetical protein
LIPEIRSTEHKREKAGRLCENIFLLLRGIKLPKPSPETKQVEWSYYVDINDTDTPLVTNQQNTGKGSDVGKKRKRGNDKKERKSQNPFRLRIEPFKKVFQECWMGLLGTSSLPDRVFCSVLRTIHTDLIPNFSEPLVLMDLLSDSYDKAEKLMRSGELGASTRAKEEERSLSALNGLFTLIIDHNLCVFTSDDTDTIRDYPSFFPKLYRLLTTYIIHSEHVTQFLRMLYTFLKSP